ncbi:MAG: hypothetical protein KJ737_03885 [Proteobacteria bacterium]|nr:hypothetical protein [Pseudomonadota bacterium]
MPQLSQNEKEIIIFHGIFTVLCLVLLSTLSFLPVGIRLLLVVVLYNTALPVWGMARGYTDWIHLWMFVFVLSMFQVFPDWFLSAQLNILVFPEDGLFKFGTVSGYMAGLWSIPMFLIIYAGERFSERISVMAGYGAAGTVALIIFGGSEETLWVLPSWSAQNVMMIDHMAIYIIIPEIILGISALFYYQYIKEKPHWVKIPSAFLVMLLYLGSAAFFYFLFEKIIKFA